MIKYLLRSKTPFLVLKSEEYVYGSNAAIRTVYHYIMIKDDVKRLRLNNFTPVQSYSDTLREREMNKEEIHEMMTLRHLFNIILNDRKNAIFEVKKKPFKPYYDKYLFNKFTNNESTTKCNGNRTSAVGAANDDAADARHGNAKPKQRNVLPAKKCRNLSNNRSTTQGRKKTRHVDGNTNVNRRKAN